MSVVFIHPQTKVPKVIPFGFNWINFFFSFWGIPSYIYGLIGEGVFLTILYIFNFLAFQHGLSGNNEDVSESGIAVSVTFGLILLYSLYMGAVTNKLRAYKLVKKGYLIKDSSNPAIAKQLKRWKIRASVINDYKEVSAVSGQTNLDELKKLGELLLSGVITQSEFDEQKKKLLS